MFEEYTDEYGSIVEAFKFTGDEEQITYLKFLALPYGGISILDRSLSRPDEMTLGFRLGPIVTHSILCLSFGDYLVYNRETGDYFVMNSDCFEKTYTTIVKQRDNDGFTKYVHNPTEVNAMKYDGTMEQYNIAVRIFGKENIIRVDLHDADGNDFAIGLLIGCNRGTLSLNPGDYIIKLSDTDIYPCDAKSFEQLYHLPVSCKQC